MLGAVLLGVAGVWLASGPVLTGMVAGIAVVGAVCWTNAAAWTWYAAIGAVVTPTTAGVSHLNVAGGQP